MIHVFGFVVNTIFIQVSRISFPAVSVFGHVVRGHHKL